MRQGEFGTEPGGGPLRGLRRSGADHHAPVDRRSRPRLRRPRGRGACAHRCGAGPGPTLNHAEGQAYALWHRAEALTELGRVDEAAADSAEALSIATRIGHRGWTATAWRATGLARDAAATSMKLYGPSAIHWHWPTIWDCSPVGRLPGSRWCWWNMAKPGEAKESADRALSEGRPRHYEARWAAAEAAASLDTALLIARPACRRIHGRGRVAQGRDRLLTLAGQ